MEIFYLVYYKFFGNFNKIVAEHWSLNGKLDYFIVMVRVRQIRIDSKNFITQIRVKI